MIADQLGNIEFRHLMSFRAVAETGSFHEAAESLDYTQSAVSQHVAALEAVLGVRLLDRSRGRRTVTVTEVGSLLLRHADAIVARMQAARADLRAYSEGAMGQLRVGTYQSVGARILPATLGIFTGLWPDVEVHLVETNTDDGLLDLVESGDLDLSFAVYPLSEGPFEAVELFRDPYVLVVPAASPLTRLDRPATAKEIADLPLIGFRHCRSTGAAEAYLRADGGNPQWVFRSDDNTTVQALVVAGIGVALVPRLTVDEQDPMCAVIPTDVPPRVLTLAWHHDRYRSPAQVAFVELARQVCLDLQKKVAPTLAQ
ncbi:MAG: LysR family transcriptional regulator [Candidatus Limnocylindrales bacterium]|jgi:DNA-binding transcriptional LysR family regulator